MKDNEKGAVLHVVPLLDYSLQLLFPGGDENGQICNTIFSFLVFHCPVASRCLLLVTGYCRFPK
jgi:hypothetical protein